ncbi:MAG: DUF2480 family protein [Flavobacteriaceae bacterium]|nr:DUF2480 family protein [Flavobacteriaceae bacterium]
MAGEIVNRVARSSLVTIDLEDYYPGGERLVFDLKDWLWEGLVLREQEFRTAVKTHDWSKYTGTYVALTCSTEAIIPAWAYMLVSVNLEPFAKHVTIGSLNDLESSLYQDIINGLDLEPFRGKPLIIKGCTNKPVPSNAYVFLINKLKTVARSIQYGEACSSVPLYKSQKK